MKIILYQPKIPQNTGNIVRTCSVTGISLVLVKPLGFQTDDKTLKRAGLDYWNEVEIEQIDDLESYLENTNHPFYFFSSHSTKNYSEVSYTQNDLLIFGCELKGLPPCFLEKYPDRFVKIPMKKDSRCLNLSNAAAIASYEALRQTNYLLLSAK